MTRAWHERLAASAVHVTLFLGVLHLVWNVMGLPVFPLSTLAFLPVYPAILAIYWLRSPFVRAHAIQAAAAHLLALSMGATPWLIRLARIAGVLGEKWFSSGLEGRGINAAWSLMAMILIFSAILLFSIAAEGFTAAWTGREYRYPLVGRWVQRLTPLSPQ